MWPANHLLCSSIDYMPLTRILIQSNGDETMKYQLSLEKFVMQGFGLIIAQAMPSPLACSYHQPSNDGLSLGTCEDIFRVMTLVTKFCASFKTPVDGQGKLIVIWTKQKLLSFDPVHWTSCKCGTLFASSAENAMEGETVTIVSLYMSFLLPLVSIVTLGLLLKFTKLHLPKGSYNGSKGRLLALAGDYTAAADIFHKILVMVSDAKSSMFT
ncbi:hypothetical protein E2542_SST04586 [Spatholobus suberectus]|nr:hypothetical protein E2542_SST04586 [Spatholobus suberectus]